MCSRQQLLPFLLFLLALFHSPIGGQDQQEQQQDVVPKEDPNSNAEAGMSIATLLDSLSAVARQELEQILDNQSLTKNELNNQLDIWAQKQGTDFYTVYQGLKKAYEEARAELDERHTQQMANQTAELQEADKRIRAISNDQSITPAEEQRQIAAEMAKLPEDEQKALVALAPYPISGK